MTLWQSWLAIAVALFVAEMFIGSMYLLVLSAALAGTALITFFGLGKIGSILLAALLSIIGTAWVYYLRRTKSTRTQVANSNDFDVGAYVVIESRLHAQAWRVLYRGAIWEARADGHIFQEGDTARIKGKDGIVLLIEPI